MVTEQKTGGVAALVNVLLAVANLIVVFGLLGMAVAADRTQLVDVAINRPLPLILLDVIKFLSAAATLILVMAFHNRLARHMPTVLQVATACGVISVALLLANASISYTIVIQAATIYAAQATDGTVYVAVNGVINALGYASLFALGWWYVLVSWVALRMKEFPRLLNYLGFVVGGASIFVVFLPPLAVLVLLLSLVWSAWLAALLLRSLDLPTLRDAAGEFNPANQM